VENLCRLVVDYHTIIGANAGVYKRNIGPARMVVCTQYGNGCAIVLALTGTENAEIAKRHRLMKQFNINEADAAFKVAAEILHKRESFGNHINE